MRVVDRVDSIQMVQILQIQQDHRVKVHTNHKDKIHTVLGDMVITTVHVQLMRQAWLHRVRQQKFQILSQLPVLILRLRQHLGLGVRVTKVTAEIWDRVKDTVGVTVDKNA